MTRPVRAHIDLDALQHNLARAVQAAHGARVMAVVKDDAYGHGAVPVAQALVGAGADALGVASLQEGMALREAGIGAPIVLLSGEPDSSDLPIASRHGLDLVIHHQSQIEALEDARLEQPLRVWLKIDTGMHRLGVSPDQAAEALQRLLACPSVDPGVRLLSHLANADDRRDATTQRQIEAFAACLADSGLERCIANSAALLGWPQAAVDWVRPGLMLYGISPFQGSVADNEGLRPVMTLSTRLIAVNRAPKGAAVGYGGSWVCPEEMPIGVAAIGYGDGYLRSAPSGTPVLVNGARVPLVGRVSMDHITVDLRAQPHAQAGDPVVLWGAGLPAEEVATLAGTIAYELVCRVGARVPREHAGG